MAASNAGRRWVRGLGLALILVGLGAAGLAAWGSTADDPRPVGILTGSDLAAIPATTIAATPDGTAPSTPAVSTPGWPASFQGRPPAFGADGDPPPSGAVDLPEGYYLWSDFSGFHAWLVGDPDGRGTLTVTSDDDMTAEVVGGTAAALTTEADRFSFARGDAADEVVAVDFNPGFYVEQLDVDASGDIAVFTGAAAAPATMPLSLPYQSTD